MYKLCLNVEIVERMRTLASAFYVGAAFTDIALEKVEKIIWETKNSEYKKLDDPIERAIWVLEMTGAGAPWDEKRYAKSIGYSVADCLTPEEGFIFLSRRGLEYARAHELERVTVSLDGHVVKFNLFDSYTPYEYKRAFRREPLGIPLVSPEEEKFFSGYIPFDGIKSTRKLIKANAGGIMLRDGNVLQWIA